MAQTYTVDIWADNWFAFHVNGKQVAEDSVSITTERSFNAEQFTFDAQPPFVLAMMARDFKQDDTGLEYIGTGRQQMGDGGVILQVKDARGNVVAVSDAHWRCLVIHRAPLDKACANESNPTPGQGPCGFEATDPPDGWDTAAFDDSAWPTATLYSAWDVRPKGGYDDIDWDRAAKFIWGPDLETDNTVLCRLRVQ